MMILYEEGARQPPWLVALLRPSSNFSSVSGRAQAVGKKESRHDASTTE